jgi:hypothetical protein
VFYRISRKPPAKPNILDYYAEGLWAPVAARATETTVCHEAVLGSRHSYRRLLPGWNRAATASETVSEPSGKVGKSNEK